jgi:rhodanese-related sulfurtransferase
LFSFLKKLSPSTPTIDIVELEALIAADAVRVLDVREPHEFKGGHVRGAINVPTGSLAGRLAQLKRDKPYAVICQSGSRSMGATARLLDAGFQGAVSVRGGTGAWARSGRPVVR